MPRKPNYDFERREREKAKAAKTAERAKAKAERSGASGSPPEGGSEGLGAPAERDEPMT